MNNKQTGLILKTLYGANKEYTLDESPSYNDHEELEVQAGILLEAFTCVNAYITQRFIVKFFVEYISRKTTIELFHEIYAKQTDTSGCF